MQLYLLMVKQVLERLIQWRGSSTQLEIHREVLCPDRWRKYSDSYRCSHHRTPHLWL